jgi:hypothetical protein
MREKYLTGCRLFEVSEYEHAVLFLECAGVYAPWCLSDVDNCPAIIDKQRNMLFVDWHGLPDEQVVLAGAIAQRYEIELRNIHLIISPKEFEVIVKSLHEEDSDHEDCHSIVVHGDGEIIEMEGFGSWAALDGGACLAAKWLNGFLRREKVDNAADESERIVKRRQAKAVKQAI